MTLFHRPANLSPYNKAYDFQAPPTQIFKLILEPFRIAQIDGRDPLITNIIFSKQVWGQVRSREVIKHLKNMKKTDFFNIQIHHISSHKRPIRTLDSSNWSLWPDKSFWFYKLGIGVTWGYLGSFGVKIQTFSNLDKQYTKMKLLIPWLRKNGFRGHLRSSDPKIRGLWGHLKSKVKDFQTLTPSFGVKIKKRSGPKFASSEARG